MKKYLLILVFIILISIVSIILASLLNCTDSDGGKNYYIKGDINKGNFEDRCEPNGLLKEYFCQESGEEGFERRECSQGCLEGACLDESEGIRTNRCTETDSGLDIYTKGSAIGSWLGDINGPVESKEDFCSEANSNLQEYTCELVSADSDIYGLVQTGMDCTRGCKNGACIPISCEDSDSGKDFYTKGSVRIIAEEVDDIDDDTCMDSNILAEQSCIEGQQLVTIYNCAGGCMNGACIEIELTPKEGENPLDIPKDKIKEKNEETGEEIEKEVESVFICNGCTLNKKCYPLGYRKEGGYCSEDFKFVDQLEADSFCENNFECDSNICVDGKCVSGSLLWKIINWFKKIFGAA